MVFAPLVGLLFLFTEGDTRSQVFGAGIRVGSGHWDGGGIPFPVSEGNSLRRERWGVWVLDVYYLYFRNADRHSGEGVVTLSGVNAL